MPGRPRFSNQVGAVFLSLATIAFLAGIPTFGWVLALIVGDARAIRLDERGLPGLRGLHPRSRARAASSWSATPA